MTPIRAGYVEQFAVLAADSVAADVLPTDPARIAVASLGLLATVVVYAWVRRDARENEVPRAWLWPALASGAVALGLFLYLFAPVPMTGVIMTANTGLVLYGFERELATREPASTEPGTLPRAPASSDGSSGSENE